MDIVEQITKLFVESLDFLFIASIVIIVEVLKKTFPRFPKKLWTLADIGLGFILAWAKMPTVRGHGKEYFILSIEYAAGAVLLYQVTHSLLGSLKDQLTGKKRKG